MFSGLIIASIVAPVSDAVKDEKIDPNDLSTDKSFFEAMSNGALEGGKMALIVGAMLIAFIGFMEGINWVAFALTGITVQDMLGYLFVPLTFLLGIPASEMVDAGAIMGLKIVTNEFVAILGLNEIAGTLSERTLGIVSAFLISFANFSSIGIISGSMKAINGEQASHVAKFGLKLLLVATMASLLTATMVGLFI